MTARASVSAFIVLLASLAAACAEPPAAPPARDEVVQALLERSRLLADVHFRVPVAVWRRYRRSVAAAGARAAAPVAVIAQRAVYRLQVPAGRKPTLSAELTLRVFDPENCRNLPVLDAGRAWRRPTVNGKAAGLATAERMLRFSPAAPGLYVVAAETTEAKAGPDGGRVTLRVPRTVLTHVRFDSPGAWEVWCPRGPGAARGAAKGGTHALIPLSPRRELEISFRRPPVRFDRPPQYRLRGHVAWNLDAGRQEVAAKLDVEIIGGRTDRLDLVLPAAARRLEVTGPDVRDVRRGAGGAAVHLRGRVRERTALTVRYELPPGRGLRRLAGPELAGGHWAGGTLVITSTAGASEVVAESARSLRELAPADIPPSAAAILAGPAVLAYRITGRRWTAVVDVVDLAEFALRETVADLAHYRLTFRGDGTIVAKVRYEIRNRARQFVRVRLPAGSVVLQARVNDQCRPLSPAGGAGLPAVNPPPGRLPPPARGQQVGAAGGQVDRAGRQAGDTYKLALVRSKASVKGLVSFPVELVYLCRVQPLGQEGRAELPLPAIDLPIAYAWCEVYVPRRMKVKRWSGPLREVARYSSQTATASVDYGWGELAEGYRLADRPVGPSARPRIAPKPEDVRIEANLALTLGRNYWRAGQSYYERNDYSNAAESLNKVLQLAPNTPEAANARRLLANIRLARGRLTLRSRVERAAGAQAKKEIEAGYVSLLAEQQRALERGLKASRQGRRRAAAVQFGAAEALSRQLIEQGADVRQQAAIMRRARRELSRARARQRALVKRLGEQLKLLRKQKKYDEALEVARLLHRQAAAAGQQPDESLQRQLDELVVAAARVAQPVTRKPPVSRPAARKPTRVVTRTYDINDLVVDAGDVRRMLALGATGGGGPAAAADRRRRGQSVARTVGNLLAARRGRRREPGRAASVRFRADRLSNTLVVTATGAEQRQVAAMLNRLRGLRGPQVQAGTSVARQRAKGLVADAAAGPGAFTGAGTRGAGGRTDIGGVGAWFAKDGLRPERPAGVVVGKELKEFIVRNYDWASDGRKEGATAYAEKVVEKLASNLGQKVDVRSVNINADAGAARALGARFQTGANGVVFAIVDEAQFRTLRQIGDRLAASGRLVAANPRRQETVVGTDALLANGMLANVTFAADRGNSITLNGNVIDLPHHNVILIDNGGYLTAVNAGAMRHWTQKPAAAGLGEAPEDIEIPRAGRLVKFEKTLVNPTDRLVLTAEYIWEGD